MPSSLGPNRAWISSSVSGGPETRASAFRNVAKQIANVSAMVPSRSKIAPASLIAPILRSRSSSSCFCAFDSQRETVVLLVQLVQCELEAWHKRLHKISDFRKRQTLHGRPERFLRFRELLISGRDLLTAFEIRTEFVGGADELSVNCVRVRRQEERFVISLQVLGKHLEEPARSSGLNCLVRRLDIRIEVLDRCGEIAREDF